MTENNNMDGNPIINLYKSMLNSSDPEVKKYAQKIGYKEFSNKLVNDKSYRDEIYYGLSKKGLTDLEPSTWESSLGLYKDNSMLEVLPGSVEKRVKESTPPPSLEQESAVETPPAQEELGFWDTLIDAGKTIIKEVAVGNKRGELVQEMSKNASAIDQAFFDKAMNPNLMNFDEIARINREIEEYGETELDKRFADPNRRRWSDWALKIIPTVLGSAATLARSGYDEILAGGAMGGGAGLAAGAITGPGAALTGATGLVTGASAGGAAAAAEMEYVLRVMDELKEKGVDIKDPNALRKAWSNKNLMNPIRSNSVKAASIVLAADLAGGFIGSGLSQTRKVARETLKAVNPTAKVSNFTKVKDGLVDFAIDAGAGMTGETGAILATKGKITGKDVPDIVMEGFGATPVIETIGAGFTAAGKGIAGKKEPAAPAAIPPAAAPVRGTEEAKVTQEEFDDFVQNNKMSEGRAVAVAEDAQLAMSDPKHMESLMAADPLYAGMVEKFIEKGLDQKEIETITQVAYQDTAQFYGMTQEELMNAVNQDHPSFNQEIADTFNNTFNRLFQSYREANDSQNITGVSGQVGKGQESQQAQPQQAGGTQETGGSGVLQTPQEQVTPAQGTTAQVGQVVEIDGKRYYVKDEGGGKLVVETDEGKIYEIPSDNPTIESIGATLLREAQPDKNYGIQVNNNDTATINGEKYSILRDKKGNVIGAKNQRRANVTLNKAEVLGELQRQLKDPNLRQLTTVSVQQPLTQINEAVQQKGTAATAEPTQPQPVSSEMAGQPVQEGGQAAVAVQPGTEGTAQAVGAPVSGVAETPSAPAPIVEAPSITAPAEPVSEAVPAPTPAPAPAAPAALPSFEEYDSNFKGEGLKKGQRMQNKQEFSNKYGAEVYEGMRKINDNFTRITDALIKEGRLNKKC